MKSIKAVCFASTLVFLAALCSSAQTTPGTIAAIETQTPKVGMTSQYEQGRKQKADWHKQQKDPLPLSVFEILSGDNAGSYYVGRFGQHWADFDKPAISDKASTEEFNKVVGSSVESVKARYYQFMPKLSNTDDSTTPSKYYEIITIRIRSGKAEAFRSALDRFAEAVQKTKWPAKFEWYQLINGGYGTTWVLALPHPNWADFGENPNVKPFREMLKDAFGQVEADSIFERLEGSIESEYSEVIEYRAELSYQPAN
jgi:hypothetical protein